MKRVRFGKVPGDPGQNFTIKERFQLISFFGGLRGAPGQDPGKKCQFRLTMSSSSGLRGASGQAEPKMSIFSKMSSPGGLQSSWPRSGQKMQISAKNVLFGKSPGSSQPGSGQRCKFHLKMSSSGGLRGAPGQIRAKNANFT